MSPLRTPTLPVGAELTVSATHPDGVGAIRLYVDDTLVAEVEGDSLSWLPEGYAPGDTVTLRAVAESADVEVSTPGWPQEELLVRARTQGWSISTLSLSEAAVEDTAVDTDTDTSAPSPGPSVEEPKKGGCGGRAVLLVWLGLLLSGRRSQRKTTRVP